MYKRQEPFSGERRRRIFEDLCEHRSRVLQGVLSLRAARAAASRAAFAFILLRHDAFSHHPISGLLRSAQQCFHIRFFERLKVSYRTFAAAVSSQRFDGTVNRAELLKR